MLNSSKGRVKLYSIWLRQDGLCAHCASPITKATPWVARRTAVLETSACDKLSTLQLHHSHCRTAQQDAFYDSGKTGYRKMP